MKADLSQQMTMPPYIVSNRLRPDMLLWRRRLFISWRRLFISLNLQFLVKTELKKPISLRERNMLKWLEKQHSEA